MDSETAIRTSVDYGEGHFRRLLDRLPVAAYMTDAEEVVRVLRESAAADTTAFDAVVAAIRSRFEQVTTFALRALGASSN